MIYINNSNAFLRTRCAKEKQQSKCYNRQVSIKMRHRKSKNKLKANTQTRKRVLPPIMITKIKWWPLAFSHKKVFSLIFSSKTEGFAPLLLKTRSLRSFQVTQTKANQITFQTEYKLRGIPTIEENCVKCSRSCLGSTVEMPTHFCTFN